MLSQTISTIKTELDKLGYQRCDIGFYYPMIELVNKKIYLSVVANDADGEFGCNYKKETQSISVYAAFKDEGKDLSAKLTMQDTIENAIIEQLTGIMTGTYKIKREQPLSQYGHNYTPMDPFYWTRIDITIESYS